MLSSDFNLLAISKSYFSLKWQDQKHYSSGPRKHGQAIGSSQGQEARAGRRFFQSPGLISSKDSSLNTQPGHTVKCPFLPLEYLYTYHIHGIKLPKFVLASTEKYSFFITHSQRQRRICHMCIWMAQREQDRYLLTGWKRPQTSMWKVCWDAVVWTSTRGQWCTHTRQSGTV